MSKKNIMYDHQGVDRDYYKKNLLYPAKFPSQIHAIAAMATTPLAYKIWAHYSQIDKKITINIRQLIQDFDEDLDMGYTAIRLIVNDLKRANLAFPSHVDGKWDLMELHFESWSALFGIEPNIIKKFL